MGETCGRICRARRLAVLVDGQAYFRALGATLATAERQVLIAGWDLDPSIRLWHQVEDAPPQPRAGGWWTPGGLVPHPLPAQLGDLLDDLATRRRRLHAHILAWDFGTLFAIHRGFFPVYHLDWSSHRRVSVRLDGAHPLGASVHHKAVCVDDRLAFAGGIDLTAGRWDRPSHDPDDPLRIDAHGNIPGPWHDLQLMVEGDAAAAIGDHIRARWRLSTGQRLTAPTTRTHLRQRGRPGVTWPTTVLPDLEDIDVALVRSSPRWDDQPEIREIEALYLELFERAEHLIYIENQYLSAPTVVEALARRLAEPDGPEVIIVTSQRSEGFLEQASMDARRAQLLRILHAADSGKRLRVLYPQADPDHPIKVHAKAALVDDRWLTVGSANLAGRSMGLDVELNLAVEALGPGQAQVRAFIPQLRARLLAEHLGTTPAVVVQTVAQHAGSWTAAVDALSHQGRERTLRPIPEDAPNELLPIELADPEHAVDLALWAAKALPEGAPRSLVATALRVLGTLVVLAALQGAWHHLPGQAGAPDTLMTSWIEPTPGSMGALGAAGLALSATGILPLPMGALLTVVGFGLGTSLGLPLAIAAGQLGALLGYATGRILGPNHVRSRSVARMNSLTRKLARGGILSIAELRIVPRYVWADVNLLAGASRLDLPDFLGGTLLGLAPGAVVFVGAGALLGHAVRHPRLLSVTVALVVATLLVTGLGWLWHRQRLLPHADPTQPPRPGPRQA